jgi:hypothetical protein
MVSKQPTNEEIKQELDEIKKALGIQTVAETTSNILKEIKDKLSSTEKESKKGALPSQVRIS